MSSNAGERDVARRMGFGRPRPRLQFSAPQERLGVPTSLIETLGIRSGMKAAFVGVTDTQLRSSDLFGPVGGSTAPPLRPVDVIVFQAGTPFALRRIHELASLVKEGGALWVLWPRDQSHITEGHVRRSGLAAGLVDVAVTGVSDRLSGLKFIHSRRVR